MKILHINTLSSGGAANAAIRLHHGLIELGHNSSLLTLSARANKIENHIVFPQFSKYGLSLSKRIKNKIGVRSLKEIKRQEDYAKLQSKVECFSSPFTDYKLAEYINNKLDVDIINLHWAANFLDYKEFFSKIKKPIVWTLHDENPFSSYWHYSNDHIQTSEAEEIHRKYLSTKAEALTSFQNPLHIVAPSEWIGSEAKKSRAFNNLPGHHIPYGIDTKIYKPTTEKPQSLASIKDKSNLIGLFICQSIDNKRKGMQIVLEAICQLPVSLDVTFIAVGKIDDAAKKQFPKNIFFTGEISDENELARLYNLTDFTLIPSLQDNLPNTMIESLCCGTPVLGTPPGGIPEVVNRNNNGLIAKNFTPQALAELIVEFSKKRGEFDRMNISENAHNEFSMNIQANTYLQLYKRIVS